MLHYTLNTGHTRESPRDEVRDDVLEALHPFTLPGRHVLPHPLSNFRVVVPQTRYGCMFSVYLGRNVPIVSCGVADTLEAAAEIWPGLEDLYLHITDAGALAGADFAAPREPESLPWLAVVLLGPVVGFDWLGDFERCLAWAWLVQR